MRSSKYLISQGPSLGVNLDSLANFYAEDERKRREHGERLEQRDAQKLQVMKEESPIAVLQQVAQFSSSASQLVKAIKAREAKNQQKTEDKIKQLVDDLPEEQKKWLTDDLKKFNEEQKGLEFDFKKWQRRVLSNPDLDPAIKRLITSQHGGAGLAIQKTLGYRTLNSLVPDLHEHLKNDPTENAKFSGFVNSGNTSAQRSYIRTFGRNQLRALGFNDDFILSNFEKPLESFVNTKGVLASLRDHQILLTEVEKGHDEDIDNAREEYNNGNATALINTVHNIYSANNFDTAKTVNQLVRLARFEGKLTTEEIAGMKAGLLDPKHKFKAGDTGKNLFSDADWRAIENAALEYSQSVVNGHTAKYKAMVTNAAAQIITGSKSVEDLIALKAQVEKDYILSGLPLNDKDFEQFQKLDPASQDPNSYAAARLKYESYFTGSNRGNLTDEFVKTIPNKRVATELGKLLEEDKAYYAEAKMPLTKEQEDAYSKGLIVNSTPQKLAKIFGPMNTLTDEAAEIRDHLTSQRKLIHTQTRDEMKGQPVAVIKAAAEIKFKAYRDLHGFDVVDDGQGGKGIGMLSANNEGKYLLWRPYQQANLEYSTVGTKENVSIWGNRHHKNMRHFGGNKDQILDSSTSTLDQPDLLGAVMHKESDDQGRLIPSYSAELIVKAQLLKVQPGTLLRRQLQAFIKNNPDVSTKLGLQEKLDTLYTPDVEIEKQLEQLQDKNLIFKYQKGIHTMSPNDISQMIDAISTQAGEKGLQQEVNQALVGLKKLTHADGTQLYEDEAIKDLLDQGAITFKNGKLLIYGKEPFSLQKK